MKRTPAKGVKGHFIWWPGEDPVFRVYHKGRVNSHGDEFTDYDLHYYDLDITIESEDAELIEYEDGTASLDYDEATLGRYDEK